MRTDRLVPLPDMVRAGASRAGIAFADVRREVTHAELAARTERLAGHLADLGVRPADRVVVLLDGVAGVESVVATVRAGAVAVPLDATVDDAELARLVADARATTVITDAACARRVSPRTLIVDGPYDGAALDYEMLATTDPVSAARDGADLDGVSFLCHTAGVTGPRRGVPTTQRNLLWAALGSYGDVLSAKDRLLWTLPLHCGPAHVFAALATGVTVWLAAGRNSTEVRHALAEQQSTVIAANAMMFAELRRLTQSVRFGLLVGSGRADSRFPLLTVYTITETAGPVAMSRPGNDGLVPIPGVRVAVADDGEILVSGPTVTTGGWYQTGDLGTRDELERLTVTGRVADLINVGDEVVRLEEVDAALRSVPGVRDAAIAHGPVAYVVADDVDAGDLFTACRTALTAAAVPAELYGVRAIPRTATGSPLRHRLPGLPARLLGVAAGTHETLFAQHWEPLPEVTGEPGRWAVTGPAELTAGLDAPGFVVEAGHSTVAEVVGSWLAEHTHIRLVLLTHGAVHAGGYAPDPDGAAIWSLGRQAQSRHPGRLVLLDADKVTDAALVAAVASGEPELALRAGELLRPTYTAVPSASAGRPLSGTVVVVGDEPSLAYHLVAAHDVRELILTGPASPPEVPGVDVVHRAGIAEALEERLVDGVVGVDLTAREAWTLHETTLAHNLSAFVLLNSHPSAVADALVRHRRILELPAVSVTWNHDGFTTLPPSWRTPVVDAALAVAEPCVVAGLRGARAAEAVRESLKERVLSAQDRVGVLLDVVRAELVGVLGLPVARGMSFRELGLDWLATVRFRTRLCAATGLDLPATLTSVHPTPTALAEHLLSALGVLPPLKAIKSLQSTVDVVEQAPPQPQLVPWLLSAPTEQALREEAAWLARALGDHDVLATARTLAARPVYPHRAAITGTTREELTDGLRAVAAGALPSTVVGSGGVAFLFTGQGAQRVGMGAELSARFPVFRTAFDEACDAFAPHLPTPLNDVLNTEALHDTEFSQPALFAVQVALLRLLESWGVRPDYVAGHAAGELAAAYAAGVWSLADAAQLVAARARLMQALPRTGAMVVVEATVEQIAPLLSPTVSVAAVNGPTTLVLSGEASATLAAAEELADRGRKTRRIPVTHAFHSPQMDPMLARLESIAHTIPHRTPVIPLISTLSGEEETPDARHWATQARSTVHFTKTLATLTGRGVETFVELGPDAVLTRMTRNNAPDRVAVPTMADRQPETSTVARAFGRLFTLGSTRDTLAFFPAVPEIPLPDREPHRRSA
ncbi:acyltransferase domain-containing protein [Actinophytocola oryzae]|uniref:AMP-binding enzyme n=1 Tax=Actinophytocola oryzae TaxID=502181 RepID=A0A4R7VUS8_9PSEU|nr:acyltransferase domain-containing protein [Actinophytocola oryzae]TDV53604.1 AMP-binding enzyme [Actinophytocola oryzae]